MRRGCRLLLAAAAPRLDSLAPDAIVIGGGTAGCLVAGRLAMDNLKTLLVEEGVDIRQKPEWYWTLPCSLLVHRVAQRGYERDDTVTVPQQSLPLHDDGAREATERVAVRIPTPRVLGGHGVMGSRCWHLGDARDWDGAPWSFRDELLPRLRKFENPETFTPHRGRRGKFTLARPTTFSPYYKPFCEAVSTEVSLVGDLTANKFCLGCSCGRPDLFIDGPSAKAHSTLHRYLIPSAKLQRPLYIACETRALAIQTALPTDGRTSTAALTVALQGRDGAQTEVRAPLVVVCAGTIGSARLLHASAANLGLAAQNIGERLWDVPQVVLQYSTKDTNSLNSLSDTMVRWFVRSSLKMGKPMHCLTSSWDDLLAYFSTTGDASRPDWQLQFQPFTLCNDGTQPMPGRHGCQFIIRPVRPRSRGRVAADGSIDPCYFSDPQDYEVLQKAVAHVEGMVTRCAPLRSFVGPLVAARMESSGINGGTCFGLVDPESLQLKGVNNVYVCGGGVLPSPLSGSTLPYNVVLSDRLADHLLHKKDVRARADKEANGGTTRIVY